jgi:site-specific DNA-cytosine methylase
MIAMHVVQYQHDSNYNKSLSDDGIEHVYYSKFEMVENDLDDFMEDHTAVSSATLVSTWHSTRLISPGPRPPAIDIVIGGPPCSDDSGVNA